MIRAKRVYFQTSKTNLQRLFDCNRESAKVWNDCLRHAKAYHLQHNGKWINKSTLQALTKGNYHLHSQSIQAVFEKYLFARDATRAALQKKNQNRQISLQTKEALQYEMEERRLFREREWHHSFVNGHP